MITDKMKENYLKAGGVLCPYCGSSDIAADHMEHDGNEAWCEVSCKDCKKTWTDLYKLVDITEDD